MRANASEKREKGKPVDPPKLLRNPEGVSRRVAETGNSSTTNAQPHADMSPNNLVNNLKSSKIRQARGRAVSPWFSAHITTREKQLLTCLLKVL